MSFEVYRLDNKIEWDKIVESFCNYEIAFLSAYVDAFKENGDGEPLLFYYQDNKQRAINVMYKRDIAYDVNFIGKIEKNKFFDLSSPYGYGGWIFDKENIDWDYKEYIDWCKNNNIVCEFIRFSLFSNNLLSYYGNEINRQDNVMVDLRTGYDQVFSGYSSGTKKDIKHSKKSNLEVIIDKDGKYIDDFINIYYSTMSRTNAKDEYYFKKNFFEKLLFLNNHLFFIHVKKDNVIVSTELILASNKCLYSFLGGTLREYYPYHPNHLLKDEVIKYGIKNGYDWYILGGGYKDDDGIYKFKKSFSQNTANIIFKTGQCVFDNDIYLFLCNQIHNNDSNYFPQYRVK